MAGKWTRHLSGPFLVLRIDLPEDRSDQVLLEAERLKATSFDAPGATYTHRGNKCTFEVLIDEYSFGGDPALTRLAKIVHAADISDDLETDPLGAGLLAIGIGRLYVESEK